MRFLYRPAALILTAALFSGGAGRGHAAALLWQVSPRGSANSFDWAHDISLDEPNGIVYAAGKSSSTATGQNIWINSYQANSGFAVWAAPFMENFTGAGCWGFEEELGTGLALWRNGALLLSGRSAQVLSSPANVCAWFAHRGIIANRASALTDNIPGTATGFLGSPAARGLDAVVQPVSQEGWIMSLSSSAANSLNYSFAKYTSDGSRTAEFKFPITDRDWPGDCCYDYPARMAASPAGDVIFALMGTRYTTADDYGFILGRFNTTYGGLMQWPYEGTGHGRDMADALAVNADGSRVFVLAKTSETSSGFMTRLLCFDNGGVFLWRVPLQWDGVNILDAAFSLAPDGTIWIVESATGRALQYSQGGVFIKKVQLPVAGDGTHYIGSVITAENSSLYVAGLDGSRAWVAKYSMGETPPPSPCQAYNYPNPFDSDTAQTTIRYVLPADATVSIVIYDLLGKAVKSWEFQEGERGGRAGINELVWEGKGSSQHKVMSGMYLARLATKPNVCEQVLRIGVRH